ncbi:MAG: hypothetical protein HN999_00415 [Candidatus Marinimicrobia bacterium]|nr:hypothetical protein [Candidatus Neomarinimicrobiota bacterium]MBT6941651.1 hypothetical protein [Candidatus Neomarinimicrobiota bacterium]MBT7972859.1 hypothetical protein [Candidatus Neomarinimicrobiota bacterium]
MKKLPKGGFYYPNEVWFSKAYQSLTPMARELLHCFLTELRWTRKGKKKIYTNNRDISFTESEFKGRYGCCSSTYIKARNQLIEVGFINQISRGGMCRGDRATYKILVSMDLPLNQERWRNYPEENWKHEIPRPKKQMVGVETQWKEGECGRKS